jgi:RimJ/RimL family protein N-acetyltransferase
VDESRASIGRWMPWCHAGYSRDDALTWVAGRERAWVEADEYTMLIVDAATGAILGSSGLNQINRVNAFANLGYWVRASAQRRGVASAGVRLVARYGFDELRLGRVEIVTDIDNVASRRTAERAGARFEGVCRNRLRQGDRWHDAALYGLIPADLP